MGYYATEPAASRGVVFEKRAVRFCRGVHCQDSLSSQTNGPASTAFHAVVLRTTAPGVPLYGYRHLSTELGRWPSRDPVLETGFRDTIWEYATAHFSPNGVSANEYGFVFNNPALFVDPQGAEIICGSIVIGVSAWELGAWLIASITAYYVIHEATDVAVVTIQGYVSDCGSCKKDKTRTEKTTRKRVKSKCVSGTWMVGHCGRNGPVSWDPACQLSPYAFGPTKGAAKAASLAGLPPTCWSAGVSYHHCNTFVCKGGAWIPTF